MRAYAGDLEQVMAAEAAAVEAEEFERAAGLSADADSSKQRLAQLESALRRADAACEAAVSSPRCRLPCVMGRSRMPA
jgi:hypothetical protein